MKKILYIGSTILLLLVVIGVFLFFISSRQSKTPTPLSNFFGFGGAVSTTQTGTTTTNTPQPGNSSNQKIFKISDGPIAGAAFTQTFNPTTTLARFTRADNGHVFDVTLGVSGAVSQPVSNTTIPGIVSSLWTTNGSSTVMQYIDSGVLKSVYMAFAPTTATSSSVTPLRIRFLPNSIVSLALSPDNVHVGYLLLNTNGGVDGYVANLDGTNAKFLFSIPLSQVILSWPSQGTLLVQTKSAVGIPGIAYSINSNTGALSPILYTQGLTASANKTFTKVVYQTSSSNKTTTYAHDIATGKDAPLANNPLPEKCVWAATPATDAYCAAPLDTTPANYLDLWHKGLAQTADGIVDLDTNTGIGTVITLPGDGGVTAEIEHMTLSPDGQYLLFITRGDQSLWGVRLQ